MARSESSDSSWVFLFTWQISREKLKGDEIYFEPLSFSVSSQRIFMRLNLHRMFRYVRRGLGLLISGLTLKSWSDKKSNINLSWAHVFSNSNVVGIFYKMKLKIHNSTKLPLDSFK